MKLIRHLLVLSACVFAASLAQGAEASKHAYAGPKKCKMCHDTEASGKQFTIWKDSAHAKAFTELASPKALEVAKAKGIADPAKDEKCLKCHVTGHGQAAEVLGKKWAAEDGVTCEGCHGFGGDYFSEEVMKDEAKAKAAGLITPDEKVCKGCHNEESPTFKGFDFAEYSKKIAHAKPKA